MEIVDQRTIFNNNFRSYIKNDRSDYLNKLLKFLSEDSQFDNVLEERIEEFQKAILTYVLSNEDESDYEEDIDDVRKNRVNTILFNLNNYLISLEPSDAVDRFLNDSFKSIIEDAELYTEMYKKRIADKIIVIKNNTIQEIEGSRIYKQMIDELTAFIERPATGTIRYSSMNTNVFNMSINTPLIDVENFVNEIEKESSIINKFNHDARGYIIGRLEATNESKEDNVYNQIDANICESILMNYTLLSLYSNTPEKLKVTENMLKSLLFELSSGQVSRDDIIDALENGNIKFSKDEMNYINHNFVDKLFGKDEKKSLSADHLIKLVK